MVARERVRGVVTSRRWRGFLLRIVLPAILAGVLFVLAIFLILIPSMERELMEGKKQTTQELTRAAVSILQDYYDEEQAGRKTRQQAQSEAAAQIRLLRYGDDGKDYFWITDTHPTMVMHPYLPELDGQD
ncbi:MAG: cache domain-containing protein, partial [bacterium]